MARTDTVGKTLAAHPDSLVDHDAVVVGGGAAGLSAAVFLARYGLETLILARGKSAIHQCAHLENYLGFPGGISPERFLTLGRVQVEHEGGTVREELVEHVERNELPSHEEVDLDADGRDPDAGGFRVASGDNEYHTRYVVAATAYDGDMVEVFLDEIDTDDEHGFVDSDDGRTEVDGFYAAGWMTDETVHQVAVSVGHGARAAIALIRDDLAARYWPAVADQYVDWVVHGGRYGGEGWDEHTREWFEEEVLVEGVGDKLAEAALSHLRTEFRAREIDTGEREHREREGQWCLLEHIDDDLIREYMGIGIEPAERSNVE